MAKLTAVVLEKDVLEYGSITRLIPILQLLAHQDSNSEVGNKLHDL